MIKVFIACLTLVMVAFAGYGVAKACNLHVSGWWSAGLTVAAMFLFGFAEGID